MGMGAVNYTKINNKEEFLKFYHYRKADQPNKADKYPKKYPCYMNKEDEDFGIMGYAWVYYIAYPPKFSNKRPEEIFEAGLGVEWTPL